MSNVEEIKESTMMSLLFWIAAAINIVAGVFFLIAPKIWQIMSLLEVMANRSILADAWGEITPGIIALALYIVAVVFFIIAVLDILCAYGSVRGKDWTTPFGIAAAVMGLINFPVGSVLSIIILAVVFWGVVERNVD